MDARSQTLREATRSLTDVGLDNLIDRRALALDALAQEFEELLAERDRRGVGRLAITGAAGRYLRDRQALRQDEAAL